MAFYDVFFFPFLFVDQFDLLLIFCGSRLRGSGHFFFTHFSFFFVFFLASRFLGLIWSCIFFFLWFLVFPMLFVTVLIDCGVEIFVLGCFVSSFVGPLPILAAVAVMYFYRHLLETLYPTHPNSCLPPSRSPTFFLFLTLFLCRLIHCSSNSDDSRFFFYCCCLCTRQ